MALLNTDTGAPEPAPLLSLPRATNRNRASKARTIAEGASEYASALHHLDKEHRKLRTAFADRLGLTHNEYDAFIFVVENGTATPKDLAAALRFTTGATTAMIDRLENVDLVRRTPNPTDRRSVLIEPTPHGQAQADGVIVAYTRIASDAITSHPSLTRAQLVEATTHITAVITDATARISQPS